MNVGSETIVANITGTSSSVLALTGQLVFLVFILAIMLIAFYYLMKFINKFKFLDMSNNNIQIIERKYMNNNVYLVIVKVGSELMLLSVSKDGTKKISDLNKDDIEIIEKGNTRKEFMDILSKKIKTNEKMETRDEKI